MLQTEDNPDGVPMSVFDGFRAGATANRSQLYQAIAGGPFYRFNRPDAAVSQGLINAFWMQGMLAGHKNTDDCIAVFFATDFTDDLKAFDVPA